MSERSYKGYNERNVPAVREAVNAPHVERLGKGGNYDATCQAKKSMERRKGTYGYR
jgi:hypothetical protein